MTTPNFADILGQPAWAVRMERLLEVLVVSVQEALAGWRGYTDALNAHIADLTAQLEAANGTVQQLKDTDAAEDAAQAAALTDQIAQQIADALTAAQNPPAAPPVVEEPVEPPVEEPPAEPPVEEVPPTEEPV